MASARVELRALVDEVRRGCVRYPSRLIEEASPRSRLLRQLAEVEVSLSGSQHISQHQIEAAPPEERFRLLASKQLDCRLRKCRRVGACLACTLRPCLCPQLPPLRLGHRRERSRLEHPRSRGTFRASSIFKSCARRTFNAFSLPTNHSLAFQGLLRRHSKVSFGVANHSRSLPRTPAHSLRTFVRFRHFVLG